MSSYMMQMPLTTRLLAVFVSPFLGFLSACCTVTKHTMRKLGFVWVSCHAVRMVAATTRLAGRPEFARCSASQLYTIAEWQETATEDEPLLVLMDVPGAAGDMRPCVLGLCSWLCSNKAPEHAATPHHLHGCSLQCAQSMPVDRAVMVLGAVKTCT